MKPSDMYSTIIIQLKSASMLLFSTALFLDQCKISLIKRNEDYCMVSNETFLNYYHNYLETENRQERAKNQWLKESFERRKEISKLLKQ
jgi:hypothetical protein